MMNDLAVLELASSMARHAAQRHKLIAENMANADTPGYRARDLNSFSKVVNDTFTPRATRAGHTVFAGLAVRPAEAIEPDLPAEPNGNTVNIEDQTLRAVEAQGQHRLALTVYEKTLDLLRLGLGRVR
ncbi:FlgB family protein [Limibaculum sp. FT325]|uniref:FlgB family protein n=1 Tax=Thermohalobaculum sediminis TaxID=2939436 RepID=UPI0020BD4FAC|nr:FlgB family protein [Limibaculum sediminis]MCL5778908.1 FlgB family protein [Limibaculum sediminis]